MEDHAQAVHVVADVHERRSGVLDELSSLGARVTIEARAVGDYGLSADCVVERKFVLDLHLSVLQGRLWPQLWNLRGACTSPFLLIEGHDLDNGPLSPDAVRGALLTAIEHGIALIRSTDTKDSALWLYRLGAREQARSRFSGRPRLNSRRKRRSSKAAAELLLAATPGISFVSARALLDQFGSVAAVASASAEDLRTVPGIGAERARALTQTLHAPRRRSA